MLVGRILSKGISSIKTLRPYLIFPGCCREVMTFYRDSLQGEITLMQTFGEAPIPFPDEDRARIYNSVLQAEGVIFMASDHLVGQDIPAGQNISMFVDFESPAEQQAVFDRLAQGGEVIMPLEGPFGMLRDKFGISWMLSRH